MFSEIQLPIPAPTEIESSIQQAEQACCTCIDLLSYTDYINDPAINWLFNSFKDSIRNPFNERQTIVKVKAGARVHEEINEKGNILVIPKDFAHRVEEDGFTELCLLTRSASKLLDAHLGFANIPKNSFIEDRANAFEVQLIKEFQKITDKTLPLTPQQELLLCNEKYKEGVYHLPFGVYYGPSKIELEDIKIAS